MTDPDGDKMKRVKFKVLMVAACIIIAIAIIMPIVEYYTSTNELKRYIDRNNPVVYHPEVLISSYKTILVDSEGRIGVGYQDTSVPEFEYCIYGKKTVVVNNTSITAKAEMAFSENSFEVGNMIEADVYFYDSVHSYDIASVKVYVNIEKIYASRIDMDNTTAKVSYNTFDLDAEELRTRAKNLVCESITAVDEFLCMNDISAFHRDK